MKCALGNWQFIVIKIIANGYQAMKITEIKINQFQVSSRENLTKRFKRMCLLPNCVTIPFSQVKNKAFRK